MNPLLRTTLGLAGAGVAGIAYAGLVERNAFALRRFEVPVLPAGSSPMRVLHVSDLHLVPGQERKIGWVRRLADLRPDLVVNTGDNLAHMRAVPAVIRALEPLMQLPGVFVMGSNDYWAPTPKNPALYLTTSYASRPPSKLLPTGDLTRAFVEAGWLDLTNARGSLTVAGHPVEFVGVDDPHRSLDRYAAVSGPADPFAALTVGVTHAPYTRVLDAMVADGARLVLAGHTHGGQLCLPLYGALVTNCDLDRSRAKGLSRWWPGAGGPPGRGGKPGPAPQPSSAAPPDAAWLEVSAGLGTSPYAPVRFACRPEATLLTLVGR
ncbi:MAG TPA: metallophosphoesterase [Dermatophilaceae bacterium]|nr:metallophosphoesterase [Dermatophilaceae bacterium]